MPGVQNMTTHASPDPIREVSTTIAEARLRQRCEFTGIVSSVERSVRPIYLVEVVIDDGTAQLPLFFFGNRRLSNMAPGWRVQVEGTLVRFRGRRCLLNPVYELPAPSGEPRGHSAGQGVN